MIQLNSESAAASPSTIAAAFLSDNRIRMSAQHRELLTWLISQFGAPLIWNKQHDIPTGTRLVAVLEPPSGPAADILYRALGPDCVVFIPYSENPAFDFLKSKLKDFGTVGVSPSNGPHQFWWGGLKWGQALKRVPKIQSPLIISCYPRDMDAGPAAKLKQSLEALGLDMVIEAVETRMPGKLHGSEKADFIQKIREQYSRPILWVDFDSSFEALPSLLEKIECDFAVHKWNRWEMSSRILCFGSSEAAGHLLRVWRELALAYPDVWDGYVLDQAWSFVSSQIPLRTVWLPRSYHTAATKRDPNNLPIVVHNIEPTIHDLGAEQGFPKELRPARRASRIGAPEALVIVGSEQALHGSVSVILAGIQSASAQEVAEAVDAVVDAFKIDPAGFGRLELSLCAWTQDVNAAMALASAANHRILHVTPDRKPGADLFRRLADTHMRIVRLPASQAPGIAPLTLH